MPAARSSPSLSARSSQWQEEWGWWVSDMEEVPRLGSKEQRQDRHGGGEVGRLVGLCFFMSWAPLIGPVLVRYIATFLTSAIKSTDRTRANPIHC
jgi:hypothetical protein